MSAERVLAVLRWAETEHVDVTPSAAERLLEALAAVEPPAKQRKPWTRWSPEDDAELVRRFAAGEPVREIAAALNRSTGQIKGAVTRLQLTRSGEPQRSSLVHRSGTGPGRRPKGDTTA